MKLGVYPIPHKNFSGEIPEKSGVYPKNNIGGTLFEKNGVFFVKPAHIRSTK